MSEDVKKTNKYITKYEQVYSKLAKVTNVYLKSKKTENFEYFITSERGVNQTGFNNLLIEIPKENIIDILKEQYINEPNNERELGTIEPDKQAYEIKNIALLMLMSNRLSKEYKRTIEKNKNISEEIKSKCLKNERDLLIWKRNATSDLIASIYILEKTSNDKYSEYFSYGERKDDNGKSTFVIDLPYVGQISVHFGPDKLNVIEEAKNKANAILERKRALGQINSSELKFLRQELLKSKILPRYTGKLYEYTSVLPIEYMGDTAQSKVQEIGINKENPSEIGKEDIKKMVEIGLNEREAYYLAVKLGCNKKQLETVIQTYNEKNLSREKANSNNVFIIRDKNKKQDISKIGKKAISMTTAEERSKVRQNEIIKLQEYKRNENEQMKG